MGTRKQERLVNLVVALLETRRPLTLGELRAKTREYDQGDAETARRQFERDKDDLRRLGVPVETRAVEFGGEPGYTIDRRAYELPDVQLSPDQVAALAVAVQLTGADGQRLALAKLAARAPDPADLDAHVPVHLDVGLDPVDATLADALLRRVPLRFSYRTAAGEAAERHVEPHALVQRRGAWYLVGHDRDRDGQRVFRLDRIVDGRVALAGEPGAFVPPDDLDAAAAVRGPEAERLEVRLAVHGSARWAVERRGGHLEDGAAADAEPADGPAVYVLDDVDAVRDRAWLLGLGADVEVLAPASLRADLAVAHAAVAAAHGHAPEPSSATTTDGEARP